MSKFLYKSTTDRAEKNEQKKKKKQSNRKTMTEMSITEFTSLVAPYATSNKYTDTSSNRQEYSAITKLPYILTNYC